MTQQIDMTDFKNYLTVNYDAIKSMLLGRINEYDKIVCVVENDVKFVEISGEYRCQSYEVFRFYLDRPVSDVESRYQSYEDDCYANEIETDEFKEFDLRYFKTDAHGVDHRMYHTCFEDATEDGDFDHIFG